MKARMIAIAGAAAFSVLAISGCGSDLSASSTCQDFLNASPTAQQSVVEKLAAQYHKPDFATPLGEPDVPYYCAANPSATLGHFFSIAQD
jgi:hypothetical protein